MSLITITRREALEWGGLALASGAMLCAASACGQSGQDGGSHADSGSVAGGPSASAGEASTGDADAALEERVEAAVSSLALEQKVAQMFVLRPEVLMGVERVTAAGDATREALERYPVGGLCYFKGNLMDAGQATGMLSNASGFSQDIVGLPLFTAVDEEGGTVARIANNDGFDIDDVGDMRGIGATGDPDRAHDACQSIARYLTPLGFNLDLAPDADIVNGASETMAKRSFGRSAGVVAPMVEAAVKGFADGGILCCAKHFPGIGGAEGDSETEPISTSKTLDEMRDEELVPFVAAISAGAPMVMVGHLSCPKVTGDDMPASLSHAIVSDLLRDELGFQGVIITDSLGMGAVAGLYPASELGVAAVQAGNDMLLMTPDFRETYQGLLDAVRTGTITEERIDGSVTRIVRVKLSMGS